MRLDTRPAQWAGVALIVAWMLVLGIAVPAVGNAIPREEAVAEGQAVTSGSITITPAAGWGAAKDAPEGMVILRKDGAQMIVFAPIAAVASDPVAALGPTTDPLAADTTTGWKLGDPTPFETAAGPAGAYAVALAPQQFLTQFVIVQDAQSVQVTASGSDTAWTALHDEIVDMVKTIQIKGGGA